jgi:hypothetical protein
MHLETGVKFILGLTMRDISPILYAGRPHRSAPTLQLLTVLWGWPCVATPDLRMLLNGQIEL